MMPTHRDARAGRLRERWRTLIWLLVVASVAVAGYVYGKGGEPAQASANTPRVQAVAPPTTSPTAAPPVTTTPKKLLLNDPVTKARRTLPLQDLKAGDRVLYEGAIKAGPSPNPEDGRRQLCKWLKWTAGIRSALIVCPDGNTFEVPTGRLTPVEVIGQSVG